MTYIIQKIQELGLELPNVPVPVASYAPAIKVDDIIYTSGMLPMKNGELLFQKEVGGFYNSIGTGQEAAKLCLLNALSVINDMVGLDNVLQVIKLTGYVKSAQGFSEQPKVINGASNLLLEIFGDKGKHARAAIGVSELPLNASVELDLVVKVK